MIGSLFTASLGLAGAASVRSSIKRYRASLPTVGRRTVHNRLGLSTTLLALIAAGCTAVAAPVATLPPAAPTATPYVGLGVVSFGTGIDDATLTVTGRRSSFKATATTIAYSADLSAQAGVTSLTIIIASVSSSGTEHELYRQEVNISSPESVIVGSKADLPRLIGNRRGDYVMRFVRAGTVLAEGEFSLVK